MKEKRFKTLDDTVHWIDKDELIASSFFVYRKYKVVEQGSFEEKEKEETYFCVDDNSLTEEQKLILNIMLNCRDYLSSTLPRESFLTEIKD